MLLASGVHEINLIAQDTTAYGRDRQDGTSLPGLVQALEALEDDFWLRILYAHPRHVSEELLDCFADARHLVPYVDIPLQHINDRLLRSMGRGMGGENTRALMARLRERVPDIAVRTTFLVGYPGETESDVDELAAYMTAFEFDRLGVFAFSPEKGTPAAALTEQFVPADVAAGRQRRLLEIQRSISEKKNRQLIGRRLPVLVEGPGDGDNGELIGRTYADAPDVDNLVHIQSPPRDGVAGIVDVEIEGAAAYDLTGRVRQN